MFTEECTGDLFENLDHKPWSLVNMKTKERTSSLTYGEVQLLKNSLRELGMTVTDRKEIEADEKGK